MRIFLLFLFTSNLLISFTATAEGLFLGTDFPKKILTATRLQQSPTEVPGSMTVIDRELIKASSARSIPEILRLVPGMQVVAQNGYNSTVNYHGGDPKHSRRMQVLINGRSVIHAGFSNINWNDLPISIEDIERIEVFRGPNTVSYGTNALFGVVNIITQPALYAHGTRIKISKGSRDLSDWYINTGSNWNSGGSWLSISGMSDNGFDRSINMPTHSRFKSGSEHVRFRWQGSQEIASNQKLRWYLAGSSGTNYAPNTFGSHLTLYPEIWRQELPNIDSNANYKNKTYVTGVHWSWDISEQHLLEAKANFSYFDSKRKWNTCDLSMVFTDFSIWEMWFNPDYRVCGSLQEDINERRFDIELQDTYSITQNLRTTQGVRFRKDFVHSETFFGKDTSKYIGSFFWQGEWQATPHWLLQSGLMFEHDSFMGDSYTPRFAINYLFNPSHSLRAVYTEATRSPDLFDLKANWQYRMKYRRIEGDRPPNSDQYFVAYQGNPKLEQERMRSFELGYHGIFEHPSLTIDAKIFHDKINNMISQPPEVENYASINNYSLKLYGFEIESDWRVNPNNRLRATYTNLHNRLNHKIYNELTDNLENLSSSRHTASLAWLKQWPRDWSTSLMYFYSSDVNLKRYRQTQARLGKSLLLEDATVNLSLNWRYIFDKPSINPNDLPFYFYSMSYKSKSHVYISAEIEF